MLNILLGVIIVVCIALVSAILLQRSEGGALGMSGGGPGNFMTARGTGDFLTQATQVLAGVFFALCLLMTLLSGRQHASASLVDHLKLKVDPSTLNRPAAPPPATVPTAPGAAPSAPLPSAPAESAPANPLNPFGPSATFGSAPAKTKSAAPAAGH